MVRKELFNRSLYTKSLHWSNSNHLHTETPLILLYLYLRASLMLSQTARNFKNRLKHQVNQFQYWGI